jgi:hypothetical protein
LQSSIRAACALWGYNQHAAFLQTFEYDAQGTEVTVVAVYPNNIQMLAEPARQIIELSEEVIV